MASIPKVGEGVFKIMGEGVHRGVGGRGRMGSAERAGLEEERVEQEEAKGRTP